MNADRNLLFGILALQNDFITRDQLIEAMNAWVLAKDRPLGLILVERKALPDEARAAIELMLDLHVKRHGNDPAQSLANLSSASSVVNQLRSMADPDINASLDVVQVIRGPGLAQVPSEPHAADPADARGDAIPSTEAYYGKTTDESERFTILRPHAAGGLGEVFVALDNELNREVALKQIKPACSESGPHQARFVLEAEITGGLEHPGIVPVYSLGHDGDGRPFYAMRFIRGGSLKEAIEGFHRTGKPVFASLEFRALLRRFVDVCNAIAYAHSRGILHRDLKPGNIMLGKYGETLVVDWGLAKALGKTAAAETDTLGRLAPRSGSGSGMEQTRVGAALGTPAYMSPEQAEGKLDELGPATDVYSLGATLYTVLTGKAPFSGKDIADIMENVRLRKFQPPRAIIATVPKPLEAVCLKAMNRQAADRYFTPLDLANELEHWLADEKVTAFAEPVSVQARRWIRKHPGPVAGLAAAVLVGLVSLVVGLGIVSRKNQQLDIALARESAERRNAEERRKEAEDQRKLAEAATIKEREATALTAERLRQIELINNSVFDIFSEFDIRKIKQSGDPVEYVLAGKLVEVGKKLDAKAIHDPLVLATLRDRLGQTLISLGRALDAVELLESARTTRLAKLGLSHPDTLTSMNNLAMGYRDAGKLEKALPLLAETLKLTKAKLGSGHPDTLVSMNNLALGYIATGKLEKALPLYEETLRLRKAKLGSEHPNTLNSMNNLALGYQAAGKLEEALPLLEETLKLSKAKLGSEHPDTLTRMNNLAMGYKAARKLEKALPLYEETLRLMKVKLGSEHPDTLMSMNNLALGYQAAGKLEKALPLLKETLRLRKAKLGSEHPDTIQSINNLGGGYQDGGNLDRALPHYEEAARGIEKRRFQHEHARLIVPNAIGAYDAAKLYDQADLWRHKWLGFIKEQAGAQSPDYAGGLAGWGLSLLHRQQWKEAESKLRECLTIREKSQPDAWTTFNTQSMLGAALFGQKKYADAEPPLLKGYEGMKAREKIIPSQNRVRIPEAVDRLIELYTATNKPNEVKKWQAERAKYPPAKPTPAATRKSN